MQRSMFQSLLYQPQCKISKTIKWRIKRPVYWNKYEMIDKTSYNAGETIWKLHDSSYQGVKRLLVLAYNSTDGYVNCINADSFKKYFLPRVKFEITTLKLMVKVLWSTNDSIK